MDLECIMLSEINQIEKDTAWSHLYVESKKQTNKKGKQNNRYREETEWREMMG